MSDAVQQHAPLPPSGAERWVPCTASPILESHYPETEKSQDAKEGDAAHWVAATMLRKLAGQQPKYTDPIPPMVASITPNGLIVTEEMMEAAELFVDTVVKACGADALDNLHIEERVELDGLRWGNPDVWWASLGDTGGYLTVADFKFGHRFVDAYENRQCVEYVSCILQRPEFAGIQRNRLQVDIIIVQPRNYHPSGTVRTWTTSADALMPQVLQHDRAAQEYATGQGRAVVGEWCKDCRGRHACDALQRAADGAIDLAGSNVPLELPAGALGVELRMVRRAFELLEARKTGLEEQAKAMLRDGKPIPFFQLKQGEGRENWTKPIPEVLALGAAFGIDLAKPSAAITPHQARKAGILPEMVQAYSERPKGALQLVPVDEKQIKRIFSA